MTGRAIFTNAYAFIPKGVMGDIVTSLFPHWEGTRGWIIARPMTGFAETFAQYIMELSPGGGSARPEPDSQAQAALFMVDGHIELTLEGRAISLKSGSFAYVPPGVNWSVRNVSQSNARFHWIRKRFQHVDGLPLPDPIISSDASITPVAMPDTDGRWATSRFMDPQDIRYDMHINIVTFQPGGVIPFEETHVMEHGLYVLEGKAVYKLNADWIEVEAGDFMWLRAFCPQACYAGGPEPFRYLLYKDVNRHPALTL